MIFIKANKERKDSCVRFFNYLFQQCFSLVSPKIKKIWNFPFLGDGLSQRSDSGPQIGALSGNGASDGGAFQLALVVHYDPRIVFEIDERAVLSSKCLPLPNHDRLHY